MEKVLETQEVAVTPLVETLSMETLERIEADAQMDLAQYQEALDLVAAELKRRRTPKQE